MRTIIIFLLLTGICYADDIICYDDTGKITSKEYSVSIDKYNLPDDSGGWVLPQGCMSISRTKFMELDNTHKVNPSIIGTNDQKIVRKSQTELNAEQAARDAQAAAKKKEKNDAILELKNAGISDDTINLLLFNPFK